MYYYSYALQILKKILYKSENDMASELIPIRQYYSESSAQDDASRWWKC